MKFLGLILWVFICGTIFKIAPGDLWNYWQNLNEYLSIFMQNFIILLISFSSAIVVLFWFRIFKRFI